MNPPGRHTEGPQLRGVGLKRREHSVRPLIAAHGGGVVSPVASVDERRNGKGAAQSMPGLDPRHGDPGPSENVDHVGTI